MFKALDGIDLSTARENLLLIKFLSKNLAIKTNSVFDQNVIRICPVPILDNISGFVFLFHKLFNENHGLVF